MTNTRSEFHPIGAGARPAPASPARCGHCGAQCRLPEAGADEAPKCPACGSVLSTGLTVRNNYELLKLLQDAQHEVHVHAKTNTHVNKLGIAFVAVFGLFVYSNGFHWIATPLTALFFAATYEGIRRLISFARARALRATLVATHHRRIRAAAAKSQVTEGELNRLVKTNYPRLAKVW